MRALRSRPRRAPRGRVVGAALTAAALPVILGAPAAFAAPPAVAAPVTPVTAPAAEGPTADEIALATTYAPVVRLVQQKAACGPGEPFQPTDVAALLGNDTVSLRGPWTTDDLVKIAPTGKDLGKGLPGYHLDFPGSPLSPGCSYEEWAKQQTKGYSPTTYARVATQPGHPGLALQYWFYYPFNDFNNKHESDWEMIQVEFDAPDAATALTKDPTRVGYSQHEGVELATWGDPKLEIVGGTHPVVHPAAGSHANYFDAALFLGRSGQQGFGCDDTRPPTFDVNPVAAVVPFDKAAATAVYPWLDYEGRWGQRETSFYNGPTGPNTKDQWTAPMTWTETEGADQAFSVPASGALGTQATSAFCGIVSTGSDALRLAMSSPGWAALVITGIVLVLAWLVRRTTWRPATPLHIARRRTTGQIIASVWRMYLGRFLLFIAIGLPIAVATVLPAVGNAWITSTADALASGQDAHPFIALGGGLLLVALSPIALALGEAATMSAALHLDEGRKAGPGRAYRAAFRRAVPLLLTQAAIGLVLVICLFSVILIPVAVVGFVLSLLLMPVVLIERLSGWKAFRRSAHLVRRNWLKVVVLIGLTTALALAAGPLLGTLLILATSLPFAVSNAVAGVVYALLVPLVALNTLYVYADVVVREEVEPRTEKHAGLPAEATLPPRPAPEPEPAPEPAG